HVLAVGLWFGSAVFFTFPVALTLFNTFQGEAEEDDWNHRAPWLPRPRQFDRDPEAWGGDEGKALFADRRGVRREQGTQAAGAAVGPLFPWYFAVQGVCGLLAVIPALGWSRLEPGSRVHRVRVLVLLAALATVLVGWPLEQRVSRLRAERDRKVNEVLRDDRPSPEDLKQAKAAVNTFGLWHVYSLFLNFGTVALVTVAMA